MIQIEYQTNIPEITTAMLDFIARRPISKLLNNFTKVCCIIVLVMYGIKLIMVGLQPQDFSCFFMALAWLIYNKALTTKLLKWRLAKQKIAAGTYKLQLSSHKLWWQTNNLPAEQQPWRQLKFIYQNPDGYMIPITGFANAGRFIWLPKRSFLDPQQEQQFLTLLQNFKVQLL